MAATSTACSEQSPLRLRATSLAPAKPTPKFLSLMFWKTQRLMRWALAQGSTDASRDPLRQAAHAAVLAGDQHVGFQVLRVDLGGPGLAVQRPKAVHGQDRRFLIILVSERSVAHRSGSPRRCRRRRTSVDT